MKEIFFTFLPAFALTLGYALGIRYERKRQRARNNIRIRYMPRMLPYSGPGPQLPNLPKRNRR